MGHPWTANHECPTNGGVAQARQSIRLLSGTLQVSNSCRPHQLTQPRYRQQPIPGPISGADEARTKDPIAIVGLLPPQVKEPDMKCSDFAKRLTGSRYRHDWVVFVGREASWRSCRSVWKMSQGEKAASKKRFPHEGNRGGRGLGRRSAEESAMSGRLTGIEPG